MKAEFFLKAIFPPLIMLFGLIGNLMLYLVLGRRKFDNFSIRTMFRLLAITDSIYLFQFIEDYLAHFLKFDVRNVSSLTCKIFRYLNYSLCPISGWLLVYISFERAYLILYPNRNLYIKKSSFQIKASMFIIAWNLLVYTPIIWYHDKGVNTACDFINEDSRHLMGLFDLANSTLLPFILMFISSILIINAILKSRSSPHLKK